MPTYTFNPNPSIANRSVGWADPSVWVGGAVPNASDADVVFPTITDLYNGTPVGFFVSVGSSQSFSARSVTVSDNYLLLAGSLSVSGVLSLLQGAELDMQGGSLSLGGSSRGGPLRNPNTTVQGSGTISGGFVANAGKIYGSGLTLNFGAFSNGGELGAFGGDLSVNTDAHAFLDLTGGKLTGGTYSAGSGGTLRLNVGDVITTDAATINLTGGTIASYDANSASYRPLEDTLQAIGAGGVLTINGATFASSTRLAVAGTVTLGGPADIHGATAGTLSAAQLAVTAGGLVQGRGTISGQVDNAGTIAAGMTGNAATLVVQAPVTGTGSLLVSGGQLGSLRNVPNYYPGSTLELGAAVSQDVRFADAAGTLQLDAPQAFAGTIVPVGTGDKVILQNVALSSITSRTYTGDNRGGTLVLHRDAGDISLKFRGHYTVESFSLGTGAQQYSNSPQSVVFVPAAVAPHDVTGGGFGDVVWQNQDGMPSVWAMQPGSGGATVGVGGYLNYQNPGASWHLVGSADLNGDGRADLLWHNADGTPSVWLMGPNGASVAGYPVFQNPGASWRLVGGADLDGDGRADLLWQNANGAVSAWIMDAGGTAVGAYVNFPNRGLAWHLVGAGDLNGDGKSDLVWQNDDGTVSAWLIGGTQGNPVVSAYAGFGNPGANWHLVGTGNLNGDGRDDLVFQKDDLLLSGWLMGSDGTSVVDRPIFGYPGGGWHVKGATDANGDGRADFVWQNDNGLTSVWLTGAGGKTVDKFLELDNPGASWGIKEG